MKTTNQLDPKLTNKRSIPSHNEIIYFKEVSAIVYIKKEPNLRAKAFSGRKASFDFDYNFNSLESMKKYIDNWKKRLEKIQASKEECAKKRREYKHNFQAGDIVYTSWGYDQTNVEFFEVLEIVTNKSIKICKISSVRDSSKNEYIKPCKGELIGNPMVKRVSVCGSVVIDKVCIASKFSSESVYCTSYSRY